MSYKHFNINDRICIEEYLRKGKSINEMSRLMRRAKSSISEEIKKNSLHHGGYVARIAQEKAEKRRKNSKWENTISENLKKYIEKELKETWSPEQIEGRLKIEYPENEEMRISFKTIYTAIKEGRIKGIDKNVLRRKGKKYTKGNSNKGKIKDKIPIEERPEEINKREKIGNWEIDTVKGKKGTKECIASFADRKSRYYIAIKMKNNKAKSFNKAIDKEFTQKCKGIIKSFSCDNGKEFSEHKEISKICGGVKVYFTNPHAPWEKGTNENENGLLREFFPKGISLKEMTQEKIDKACELINNRPRKCLNWKTAREVYEEEIEKEKCY